MQQPQRTVWPWVTGLVVLALGAAGYMMFAAPGRDTAARVESPLPGTAPAAAPSVDDSAPTRPVDPPVTTPRAAQPVVSRPAPVTDSGAVRLRGVPAGSTVLIDQRTPTGAVTALPVGRHEIAVSAPLHEFFVDTVTVTIGDTLDISPQLTRLGAQAPALDRTPQPREAVAAARGPCDPGPAYDATQCFDQRPRPVEAPFVAVPAGARTPERGTQLWVRVSAAGATSGTRMIRSSGAPRFDVAAIAFVRTLAWEPAAKGGEPVAAWTQIEVRPAP
jgi:TonB family protein